MNRRVIAVSASAVLVALAAFSIFLATRHVAPGASQIESPLLGHAAPAVVATTLDGQSFSLASDRGKVVVLTFWSSWCGPCVQEEPELSLFALQERPSGVAVVGVVWEDSVSSARQFQREHRSTYSSVIDPNGVIANSYGVTGPPTTFVINAAGRVSAELVGATTAQQLASEVARAQT